MNKKKIKQILNCLQSTHRRRAGGDNEPRFSRFRDETRADRISLVIALSDEKKKGETRIKEVETRKCSGAGETEEKDCLCFANEKCIDQLSNENKIIFFCRVSLAFVPRPLHANPVHSSTL